MSLASARPRTLGDTLVGPSARGSLVYDALLVVLASALVALLARIEVPWWPIPFTLQTLGVLLVGAALGTRRGVAAMLLYLLEGAVGLPVFAAGASGIAYMLGPTGGYLLGFVVAAGVVGWLAERGWDRHAGRAALAMLVGNLVIYAFGVAWLSFVLGDLQRALMGGLVPFVLGDLLKIAIAAVVLPGAWSMARG